MEHKLVCNQAIPESKFKKFDEQAERLDVFTPRIVEPIGNCLCRVIQESKLRDNKTRKDAQKFYNRLNAWKAAQRKYKNNVTIQATIDDYIESDYTEIIKGSFSRITLLNPETQHEITFRTKPEIDYIKLLLGEI